MQTLRKTLDARGFQRVKIIAADLLPEDAWTIVDDLLHDPELYCAVSIVGSVLVSLFIEINNVKKQQFKTKHGIVGIVLVLLFIEINNVKKQQFKTKHGVGSQVTRIKWQKSFCDLVHDLSL